MKSRITRLAVAAVIIIAATLGAYHLSGSIDIASVALADVEAAFLSQLWVHLKYDNGAEQWYDLETGDHYYKDWDGRCVFVDHTSNTRRVYYAKYGQHISEDIPVIYKDGVIPQWQPKTAWEVIVGHLEIMAEQTGKGHWQVEKVADRLDGKELVRFDRYHNDAVGRRLLISQLWADPQDGLPVRLWRRLSLGDRKEQKRESITGEFDFPENGPSSIYELGVPQDLPIVKDYDKIPDPYVTQGLHAAKEAIERFPDRYRVIVWQNEGSHEVDIIYRDREKICQARHFSLDEEPYHLPVPAAPLEVLEWAQSQVAVDLTMVDGIKRYRKTTPHPDFPDADSQPVVRVTWGKSLMLSSWPNDEQWPYVNQPATRFELIEGAPEQLSGCIGLRVNAADICREFYIDPDHDYICVKWIWWKMRSGNWEKEREYELSGFARLPGDQWYATRCLLVTYGDPERGIGRGGANWTINIEVLGDNDYPPDIFNGEKLIEGAKVETY
jgi:hypothetical protein